MAALCYAYVLRHLVLRLKRHGVSDAAISVMLIDNPRKVFPLADSRLGDERDDGPLDIEVAIQPIVSVVICQFSMLSRSFLPFPALTQLSRFRLRSESGKQV